MERFTLCLKNMKRHGWRTRIIILIAIFGSFLTFIFENIIEDISLKQSDMFGRSFSGHFRIVNANIDMKNSFGYYFYEPEEMLQPEEISAIKNYLATIPEISGYEERIVFSGLLYGEGEDDEGKGFQAVAMDMEHFNRNFSDLYYAKGTSIHHGEDSVCAASWYEYEQKETKILDIGKSYVFLIPNYNREYVDRLITVKSGITYRSMPKETFHIGGIFFDLDAFRRMAGYKQPEASEIVGFLWDARQEEKALKPINTFLKKNYPHLQVCSWRAYAPMFGEFVLGLDILMKAVEAILLIICLLLVIKLTAFSIIERYNEIGTMRAIGFTQTDIIFLFTTEGFLTITIGSLIGFFLGALVISLFHIIGIKNELTFFNFFIGYGFNPSFYPLKILRIALIFLGVSIIAPLFPAIRGGRLSILKTLEKH